MSTDIRQPYQRLNTYAAKHLAQILSHIIIGDNSQAQNYHGYSVAELVHSISLHTPQAINSAHHKVCAIYKQGSEKGIYRKGRPLGSKNKSSSDSYDSSKFGELDSLIDGIIDATVDETVEESSGNSDTNNDVNEYTGTDNFLDHACMTDLINVLKSLRQRHTNGDFMSIPPYSDGSSDTRDITSMNRESISKALNSMYAHTEVVKEIKKVLNEKKQNKSNSAPVISSNSSSGTQADPQYVLTNLYNADQTKLGTWMSEVNSKFNQVADNKDSIAKNFKVIAGDIEALTDIVTGIKENRATVLHLTTPKMPELSNMGTVHSQFPTLLKMCNARLRDGSRLNVWIHGPAGTGKTFSAMVIAKTLFPDMENNFQYNGALTTSYQVLGYQDANGKYVTTAFREAWEHGGVYLFDEIDASMPDALLALNGALANSVCRFPDKLVHRHPDCIILAGANTTGQGATMEYAGRMKQDAALTDRFVFLHWPQDKALEDSIIANKVWLDSVRKYRDNLVKHGIKNHAITSRASIYGEALLAAGLTTDETEQSVIKKGLTEAQFKLVKQ